MDELLLDSRPRLEGSDEIGSVCPSFRPSFCLYVSFLRIGLAGFFRKKSPSGRNDQKWSKMAQKDGFWKIKSLVLSGICVK